MSHPLQIPPSKFSSTATYSSVHLQFLRKDKFAYLVITPISESVNLPAIRKTLEKNKVFFSPDNEIPANFRLAGQNLFIPIKIGMTSGNTKTDVENAVILATYNRVRDIFKESLKGNLPISSSVPKEFTTLIEAKNIQGLPRVPSTNDLLIPTVEEKKEGKKKQQDKGSCQIL